MTDHHAVLCPMTFLSYVLQRAALLEIYAISREVCMPIDEIMDTYLPDTSTALKAYMVAAISEMRRIDDEQQQQQGDVAINVAAAAAAAAAATEPPTSNGSSNPLTPGSGLLAAGVRVGANRWLRPAAAAPQTLGSAMRAHQDGIMAQLMAVFKRLSTHMQASSKDNKEKVGLWYELRSRMPQWLLFNRHSVCLLVSLRMHFWRA
jgi:hypothetical protein